MNMKLCISISISLYDSRALSPNASIHNGSRWFNRGVGGAYKKKASVVGWLHSLIDHYASF